MGIIDDIKELLGRDDPPAIPLDQKRINAKAAIEAWLRTQIETQYRLAPDKFAERLRMLVDTPQALRQGAYGWCLPAAFLHSALGRFPDAVVQFGLDLYRNGEASLGGIKVKMSDAFRAFDYPAMLQTNDSLPQRARDLFLASHADWLLLAGIQEDTSMFYTVSGSLRDPVSFTTGTLVDLLKDSDLYETVTDLSSSDKKDRSKLLEALGKSRTQDVLLVGDIVRFGAEGMGRHAVRLIEPPVVTANGNPGSAADKETLTFKFWSWGFQPSAVAGLPFDEAQNAFTFDQTRHQFETFDVVIAEPKLL